MSNRKIIVILSLFLFVLTSFRIVWISSSVVPTEIKAQQGFLDLRDWDFDADEKLALDGEWEFYPNALLMSDEIDQNEKKYSVKPGKWDRDDEIYGTYRLKILVPDEEQERFYQMLLPHKPYVAKVIVNGEVKIDNESGGNDVTKRKSGLFSREVSMTANGQHEIEILIHQPHQPKVKGIAKTIQFGDEVAMKKQHFTSITMQLIVVGITLLYFFLSFLISLWRRQQSEFLYFGLATLCAAFATLIDDDKLLLAWLPISHSWSVKILFLSYIGISVFLLLFIQNFFAEYKKNRMLRVFHILYFLAAFILILLPLSYVSLMSTLIFVIIVLSFATMAIIMWRNLSKGHANILFLLLAATSITSSFLWAFYKARSFTELPYYPFDILIALLSISILLLGRFFQVSDHNKELAIKLQQEIKRKDDFLANTSHELRNPLHGMINIVQSVLQNETKQLTEKSSKSIELAVTIGRHMSRTLDDLLDVTRLKEHRIQLNKESIAIHSVTSGVVDMLKFMAKNKEVQLALQISPTFPKVCADKNRLIQILFNLLHNAVKFTNDGVITIHADVQNGMANIHIKDTGIGMDQATLTRIFEPYEQGDSSLTAIGGGLGLGLSICHQLVKLHGGILKAESIIGEGTQFTFTLPLANPLDEDEPNDQVEISTEEQEERPREMVLATDYPTTSSRMHPIAVTYKPKILAVDDDAINLQVLSTILPSEQFELETVTSGKAALALLDQKEWDLVITDVMMPHMSGYELTRSIREKYSISELPVLLITARSQAEDIYTGFLAGANDYVTKPVDALELTVRVYALTDLKASIRERLRMEAAWLQAQIEPHFLFNTLNTIVSLSEVDTERMAILLDKFGYYLERSFDAKNLDRVVPFTHERELIDAYLYIEQVRFGERLQIIWDVTEADDVYVPPLAIQTLVENAIRHGVLKQVEGGTIQIRIYPENGYTKIQICDDGVGMDEEKVKQVLEIIPDKKRGIGLLNTDQRLKQLYGEGLHIESTLGKGTTVSFRIPRH